MILPGNEGQVVTGAVKPPAFVKNSVYVAVFDVTNEIVLTFPPRAMLIWGGGGGGGGDDDCWRVKVIVPSDFSSKYPMYQAGPLASPV